ncbi:hypothetical protein EV702DRAFT_349801 [Suillus placidus]|uniref:F-box domain-containing protein n=1 Tax=Suillus placidus TaxID=48579 RepID=A0A9P6ZTM2_9AGAM|nr:hypothetical protein EV702DRAFT_349801 [Suillus placidus]
MSPATSMKVENVEAICSSQRAHSRRGHGVSPLLAASTRCIMIAELRWNIFDLVAPPNMPVSIARELRESHQTMYFDFPRMRKTLLALALTCKSFTEPALDLLWRHLGGLEPLIRCLPQSLWKEDEKKLKFQRTMTLDDWSIFCKYNYRVHSLDHHCHKTYSEPAICDTEILRALSCPPFSLPLLPNLTSLTWTEASDETFHYIRLFVTPQLTMLNISALPRSDYGGPFFTFGPSEQSILSFIAQSCPSVSHFVFRDKYHSIESIGDTSTVLQCWSHLTSVGIGTVSEAALLHLSNLPSLRVLKFQLPPTPISAATQRLLQRPAFCALQELDVTCKSLVILEAFLEKLTVTPKVLSFTITHGAGSARALPALISHLPDVCTPNSLRQVRFSITGHPPDRDTSFEAAAFQPLFAFRNLRKLDIESKLYYISVRMDDAALLQMAKAWPHLEELHISRNCGSRYQVTPHAFVLLLWHCPRLVSLAVAIDWSTIDLYTISPDIPYQGFSHKALSTLFTRGSEIQNPTAIASFISAIAPNVREIEGSGDPWPIVQDLLEYLPMIREQGRKMMLNELTRGYYGVVQPRRRQ